MADRVVPCLDDREPPFPVLTFLAPKWRHVARSTPLRELVGVVSIPPAAFNTWRDDDGTEHAELKDSPPPPRVTYQGSAFDDGFVVVGRTVQVLTLGLSVPPFGFVGPDHDFSVFVAAPAAPGERRNPLAVNQAGQVNRNRQWTLRYQTGTTPSGAAMSVPVLEQPPDGQPGRSVPLLECEINHDRRLAPAWFPYIGKEVRVFGHWVEDISHDQKTEIHPIHWLTWEQFRNVSESEIEVFYRVTLFADVSGRFRSEPINARIDYQWEKIFPNIPVQDASCRIQHNQSPQYERDITQAARCERPQPNLFRFTCAVGGRQGADARNCNETRDDVNTGGYWDGWVVFRIAAPKTRRRISGGIEEWNQKTPPRLGEPRVQVASTRVREADDGGLRYEMRLRGQVAVPGWNPKRDRVSWSAQVGEDRVVLGAEGRELDATISIPAARAALGPIRDFVPIHGAKKMPLVDESDPTSEALFVTATCVRGGARRSMTTVVQQSLAPVRIKAEWNLVAWKGTRGKSAGALRYRVKLEIVQPKKLPSGNKIRWSLVAPESRRIRGGKNGALLLLHRPLHRDARALLVQVEVWNGKERVATGRELIHVPAPSVSLRVSKQRDGSKARFVADTSGFAGPVQFQWLLEGGAGTAAWCADGGTLELDTRKLRRERDPHVVILAFDQTGQSAVAAARVG